MNGLEVQRHLQQHLREYLCSWQPQSIADVVPRAARRGEAHRAEARTDLPAGQAGQGQGLALVGYVHEGDARIALQRFAEDVIITVDY